MAAAPAPSVPVFEAETQPQIQLPAANQVVASHDPWASTPAAAQNSTAGNYPSAPLGVGESWAETVLAPNGDEVSANQQAYHHAAGSPDIASALPDEGVDPAGPLEVDESAAQDQSLETSIAPTAVDDSQPPVAAQLEAQVHQQEQEDAVHQQQHQKQTSEQSSAPAMSGPPGFGQKQQAQRHSQDNAAQNPAVDRTAVQFGNLGLFDQGGIQSGHQQNSQQNGYAHVAQAQQPSEMQERHQA